MLLTPGPHPGTRSVRRQLAKARVGIQTTPCGKCGRELHVSILFCFLTYRIQVALGVQMCSGFCFFVFLVFKKAVLTPSLHSEWLSSAQQNISINLPESSVKVPPS